MRRISIIGAAALATGAVAIAAPGIAAEADLSVACGELDTVGGGEPGFSPGPTGNPATALGWDVGSGQCNGSFTKTVDPAFPATGLDGIELGMRAEQRREGQVQRLPFLSSGAGDYAVQTGADNTDPVAINRAWWNIQHSIAYDGVIDDLDALIWSIRTDVGSNAPAAPQFDMLALRPFIDARNPNTEPTAIFDELYQTSQNPEFGYFTNPADDDANTNGVFDYDEPGAWMMTLAAAKDGSIASVSVCIHTPNAACVDEVPATDRCTGFEPPLDKPVTVRKKARVLPLKMVCTDEDGTLLTDADISAPVVQVHKTGDATDTVPEEEITSSGKGTEGNEFVFDGNKFWQFNLSTKIISATGDYNITALPAGGDILVGAPSVTVTFQ